MEMHNDNKNILLVSMPFAETSIPSIQLTLLESYLKEKDIDIKTKHLYIKAAEFYGLYNYNYLINSPNDSYVAQMAFSKFVFPNHWEKNLEKFKYFYENIIYDQNESLKKLSFEKYVDYSNHFLKWTLETIDWELYDIIGFTLNYGQFLPSIALSKKIKETFPNIKIVFGGSTIVGELGKRVLKTFEWVDHIISGEGEEALFLLASDYDNYKNIKGLIYRNKDEIIWNENNDYIDIDSLPYLDFSSYYQDLINVSGEIQQYFTVYGRLPIELSRGCWWNNCTFCNIRAYHKKYREKNVDRFIEELNLLSETYKILEFQVIGTTLPQYDYKTFCNKIAKIGKDFSFYIESRAGQLKSKDYEMLKKAGFNHIQTGIETFSSNYLKKMNKGTRVIDNIAALKYCKENKITNIYNLIIGYPNEETIDYQETKKVSDMLKRYLEPPQISKFLVGYDSPIYNSFEEFNIENLEPKIIDTIMYPYEILQKNLLFFYDFKRKQQNKENNWETLVNEWKIEFEKQSIIGIKRKTAIDQLVFYYVDGKNFLKIYDKRNSENLQIYTLDKSERDVFLQCVDVVNYEELKTRFPNIPKDDLNKILNELVEVQLLYKEEDVYLSLPLSYNKIIQNSPLEVDEEAKISQLNKYC